MAKTIKRGDTEMKVSSLHFEVKEIGVPEDRTLRFIGSDDTPDRDGDVVTVEGWDLKNYLRNPVFLWAHDYSIPPVGKSIRTWRENGKLMFDIQFPEKGIYPFADLVYNLYKGGFLNATSVGFVGKEATKRDDPGVDEVPDWKRGIKYVQQELLELSAVPVPSNPAALQQAKSVGAVTDDEYASLMSFINGEFVQNPHVGAKTLKGIQNVYESQEAEPTTAQKEVDQMKDEEDTETQNTNAPLAEKQFSFVLNPSSQKTLLMDNTTGKILGDITAEVKSLITQAVTQAVKTAKAEFDSEEKAGAVLSKKNKSRLSQAKDLIIEVLGQVEDEEGMEDQKRPTAVLEDEEELNKPEDNSMNGKKSNEEDDEDKPSDPDAGEDGETEDEEDKKKKSAEQEDEAKEDNASQKSADDEIEFDFGTGKDGEYELPEDVAEIIKQAVADVL